MPIKFPISTAWVLAGFAVGAAIAHLLPNGARPSATGTHSGPGTGPNAVPKTNAADRVQDEISSPGRRSRLVRLMDLSARGGSASLAQAWREAAEDPAMRKWLAEVWMKEDPAAFIRMAHAAGVSLDEHIGRFAIEDPEKALAIVSGIEPIQARRWMMAVAIAKVLESDFPRGLMLAAQNPEVRLNAHVAVDKIKVTSADLPILISLPGSKMVSSMIAKAMQEMSVGDAMDLTSRMDWQARRFVLDSLSKRWVQEDPAAAFDYATNHATEPTKVRILKVLGEKKVTENPAAGAAWAEQHLYGHARNRMLEKAAGKLNKSDPETAASIRSRLPSYYPSKSR